MATSCKEESSPATRFGLVIHGGAGTIIKEKMTEEMEAAYREALTGALILGHQTLAKGGVAPFGNPLIRGQGLCTRSAV